jgi:UDP-glucose 4-epimerase
MKICIIGASSYVGGWIVDNLKQKDYQLCVVYRNEPVCDFDWKDGINTIIKGDITDLNVLNQILEFQPEIVVYLISLNHIECEKNPFSTMNVNVSPLVYLGSHLALSKNFKKFIYFSTLQVIGKINVGDLVNESTLAKPLNNYGLTHFFCEEVLTMLNRTKQLNYTIIRLANSYGPAKYDSCDSLWLVINDFCLNAVKNNIIQLKSDGSPQRDFVYLNDVSRAVDFVIVNGSNVPNIVNLSSENTLTMLELAHLTKNVCHKAGISVKILLPNGEESIDSIGHSNVKRYIVKSWLFGAGFKINTSLEEGIRFTLDKFISLKK